MKKLHLATLMAVYLLYASSAAAQFGNLGKAQTPEVSQFHDAREALVHLRQRG